MNKPKDDDTTHEELASLKEENKKLRDQLKDTMDRLDDYSNTDEPTDD